MPAINNLSLHFVLLRNLASHNQVYELLLLIGSDQRLVFLNQQISLIN